MSGKTDFMKKGLSPFSSLLDELEDRLHAQGLGSLNRQAEGTVPNELGEASHGAGGTEGDGVVLRGLKTVVVKERARGSVDVRVRVCGRARKRKSARRREK